MADSSTNKGIIKYSSRDYDSIMNDFWEIVPTLIETWKPESDAGEYIDKLLASCEDLIDRHYLVYAHVFPNNSAYVGMTGTSVQDRSGSDGSMYKNHRPEMIEAAQQAGGWNKIKHYTLIQGLTLEEALKYEETFTKLFQAAGYHMYNLKCGWKGYKHSDENKRKIGQAGSGRHPSDATKKKISKANTGKVRTEEQREAARQRVLAYYTEDPSRSEWHKQKSAEFNRIHNTGKHLSEETRSKIGVKMKGRVMSDEWRAKLSESHKGQVPKNAKKVIAIVDGHEIEFPSVKACSRYFGKYDDWAGMYCATGKQPSDNVLLKYKEA